MFMAHQERGGKAAHDLLAALSLEFERLGTENARLVKELEALREQVGGGSAAVSLPRSSSAQKLKNFRQPETPPESVASSAGTYGPKRRYWGLHGEPNEMQLFRFMRTNSELLAEERYENFYDLSRAFHALCAKHKITIGASEICEMDLCQNGLSPQEMVHEQEIVFRRAIIELNKDFRVTTKNRQPAQEVMLETYNVLMNGNKAELKLERAGKEPEVIEAVTKMRDILLKEDAIRKIAHATNMGFTDIYISNKQEVADSRMDRVLKYVDPFIGFVILCNAVVIGVSTDHHEGSVIWEWCEYAFTVIFFLEVVVKLSARGFAKHFCGGDMLWNLFDFFVVCVAMADLVVTVLGGFLQLGNFTLVRLLRFARLTKLVRVLKLKMFKELALLINGCLAGFRTLFWAMLLLAFILFALGVVLTHVLGHPEFAFYPKCPNATHFPEEYAKVKYYDIDCVRSGEHLDMYRNEMFGNVPRSMFTIFRCLTDGCDSPDGTPLVPCFYNTYGLLYVFMYMMCMLFVIFGLFNLIMAVFVENTIENAKHDDMRRREARTHEHIRVARKLQEVIMMFCTGENNDALPPREPQSAVVRTTSTISKPLWWFRRVFSTRWSIQENLLPGGIGSENPAVRVNASNLSLKVTHDSFHKILQKTEVRQLLDDLDIGYSSRSALFEVLDANCNGVLEVSELVQGFLKLRGAAEKGESIASLLAIRSLQRSVKAIELLGLKQQDSIDVLNIGQERVETEVRRLSSVAAETGGSLADELHQSYSLQEAANCLRAARDPESVPL